MLALSVAACSATEGPQEGENSVPGALKSGEISICTIDYYPPMEFLGDDEELTGFDVDMMDAVAEKLGVEARYIVMRFEGLLPGLDTKRCDLASAAMYLNEDRASVAEPIPYMATTAQLMVASGNPKNLTTLDDLAGQVMAIDAGTSNLDIAEALSADLVARGKEPMQILKFPSAPDTFQQIRVGRADGVIESDVVVGWIASQDDKLEYVRFQDEADGTFAVYSYKGNTEMQAAIAGAIDALYKDGTLAEIAKRYGLDTQNLDDILG